MEPESLEGGHSITIKIRVELGYPSLSHKWLFQGGVVTGPGGLVLTSSPCIKVCCTEPLRDWQYDILYVAAFCGGVYKQREFVEKK